ncbi:BTB/POZ and TAZ domain-containing protein 3 isoform X2 [Phoenix dactylifera]|uniref:BTB/POZ and TAZ domain-containing protein 3 isoform X2 n=1 Tax=Phoenix dactylifera TaxID=42345 RepID=A0A8B7BYS9_PHODC|nr:BTB/POZ and TAZ domain-containing protein 3 isoform X2 [Phoenix dactylifera]
MACLELDSPQLFSNFLSYDGPFNLHLDGSISAELLSVSDACTSSQSHCSNIPKPPPLPGASYSRNKLYKKLQGYSIIPDETKHAWDRLFYEGYEADVHVLTDDKGIILAHSSVLGITSPVLRSMLELARVKGGFRCIKIPGVPSEAARAFIRFLYSSCYELDAMKKFVLHLLVMSHTFSVPSLKRACIKELETTLLTKENVVDVLQLARECDAPRLSFLCTSLIIKEFKAVSVSEGWKVMKQANPHLEQELLETLVEADSVSSVLLVLQLARFYYRKSRRGQKRWKKERCTCSCLKQWRLFCTYAEMGVGPLVPVTRCSKTTKPHATSQLARGWSCWSAISQAARLVFQVVVHIANGCGSFLSSIPACVMKQTLARSPCAVISRIRCGT